MSGPGPDEIDISINIRSEGADVVDSVNRKLAGMREGLQSASDSANSFNQAVGGINTDVQRLEIRLNTVTQITRNWSEAGKEAQGIARGMVDSIREEGLMAVATGRQIQQLSDIQDVFNRRTAAKPVGPEITPVATANTERATAAVADLDRQINIATGSFIRMGQLLNTSSESAVIAFRAQGEAIKENLINLGAQEGNLNRITNAVTKAEQAFGAVQGVPPIATQNTEVATAAVADLGSRVNIALGGFAKLGTLVDVTSQKAVADFRAEGEALREVLVELGAEESALRRIGTTIGNVERQFGSYNAGVQASAIGVDKIGVGARRGANAVATLAFGMAAGGVSARTMAIGMGSAISAMASFSDSAAIAASAAGIGALITVLAVVIGLFYDLNHEAEKTTDTLGDIGNLRASQLRILHETNEANLKGAQQHAAFLAKQVDDESKAYDLIINIRAAFHWWAARKAQKQYDELLSLREKLTKQLVEAETKEAKELHNTSLKEGAKAREAEIDRISGPAAARRAAAADELAQQKRDLELLSGNEVDKARILEAYEIQYHERILAINREEGEKRRDLFEKLQLERLSAEAKAQDDTFQVQREAAVRRQQVDAERIRKDRDLDPTVRAQAIKLTQETLTADLVAIEKNRSDRIVEIRQEAQNKLDELSGLGPNEEKIRGDYQKQLDLLQAAIDSTETTDVQKAAAHQGIRLINALIPEEVAKAKIDAIDKQLGATVQSQQEVIDRTTALQQVHALTDQEARLKILDALIKQRDAVAASIPLLQAQADLIPGNIEEQQKVEALKTKLLDLTLTIRRVSDQFYELKQAAIDSSEKAIENFITAGPQRLFGQGLAQANIRDLANHLRVANDELGKLLSIPNKTSDTQSRIATLRTEIQSTNAELKNAKDALVTWKSLFLDAASSIISALLDVSAHMIAVYAIQKLLSMFRSGGGSSAGSVVQIVGESLPGVFGAEGGYIRGPGSDRSDSVPARLSNGEYVLRAQAVRQLGVAFLDSLNAMGPATLRSRRGFGYAEGGLVEHASSAVGGGFDATVGLEEGLVVKHLQTRAGTRAVLSIIAANKNSVQSIITGGHR